MVLRGERNAAAYHGKDMAGMRDRCVRGYFSVRYETVWAMVQQDMKALLPMLQGSLDELKHGKIPR